MVRFFFLALLTALAGCGAQETDPSPSASESTEIRFTDVTAEAGLAAFRHVNGAQGDKWFPETMGSGGGFVDIDGDDWLDVLLVGGGVFDEAANENVRKLWVYRNGGDGSFQLVEDATTAGLPGYGFGISAADVDNDGDDDIFFTALGRNTLLRNDGGSFSDVTVRAGLGGTKEWSTSSMFFDADRDGWVDLYVGNYVFWSRDSDLFCTPDGEIKGYCTPELYEGQPGRFYRNRGNGAFDDKTQEAGFGAATGKTLGVALMDHNRDGWPDVVLANDTDPDQLFLNRDGSFAEVGVVSGIAFDERGRARAGMGIDIGVVDGTGEETIFVGNFSNQMIGVYRHMQGGVFLDRAAASRIGRSSLLTLTFGLFLFDVENDGDLDLFAANGHVQPYIELVKDNVKYRQPSHLFLNNFANTGEDTFSDVVPLLDAPLADSLVGRGAAFADYDHDGDLDILVTENDGGARLWRNESGGNSFVRVLLRGTDSNRNAIGALAELYRNGRPQYRRVRTGSSFLSQSEFTLTFGLGSESKADSLVVRWPSGHSDRFDNVQANQRYVVVEGQQSLETSR